MSSGDGEKPCSSKQQQVSSHPEECKETTGDVGQRVNTNTTGVSTWDLTGHPNVTSITCTKPDLANKITQSEPKLAFRVKDPIVTFTGRTKFLEDLHKHIQECRTKGEMISILSQTSSITGLGGIGKSETVRMYIRKFGTGYDNIVWIDAEFSLEATKQFEILAFDYLKIASKDYNNKPREFTHVVADVYTKLCQNKKLLLIVFDNAEALDHTGPHNLGIRQFLPPQTLPIHPPVVLVTSRQQNWEDVHVIKLDLWDIKECIEFICKRLSLDVTPKNKKDATELAELFDRLPIAIEVAVSVISEQSKVYRAAGTRDYDMQDVIAEYKSDGRQREKVMRKKPPHRSTEVTMEVLLNVSLSKIETYDQGQGELALRILAFMAYLSPTNIPRIVIAALFKERNQHEVASALLILERYSIIRVFDNYLTIHRVFQDVVITILSNLSVRRFEWIPDYVITSDAMGTILTHMANRVPEYVSVMDADPQRYRDVVTNIVHVTNYIIKNSMTLRFYRFIEVVANLIKSLDMGNSIALYKELIRCDEERKQPAKKTFKKREVIGYIQYYHGKYKEALDTFEELLKRKLKTTGKKPNSVQKHTLSVIQTNFVIAGCKSAQGQTQEALNIYNEVLKRRKQKLGLLHPQTLQTKMNIAVCFGELGKKEKALSLYTEIYKDQEIVIGPLHLETLRTKQNTASCLMDLGRKEEALSLYTAVYEGQEKVVGPLYPDTLVTKMNTANCLKDLNKKEEALRLYTALYEDQEIVIGPLHPETMRTKMNTAICLAELGKKEEAMSLYTVVYNDQDKVLGPLHPDTLKTQMNIAICLEELGRMDEALSVYTQVSKDQEKVLGPLHQETFRTKMNTGMCLAALGKKEEALEIYTAVYEDQEKFIGPFHPDTFRTKTKIARCLSELNRPQAAIRLYTAIYEDQEKLLGPLHPDTLKTKMNIPNCLSDMGKKEEALSSYTAVYQEMERVLGPIHPDTLGTKMNAASCLSDLGKKHEALSLYTTVYEDQEKVFGPRDPDTLRTKFNTANCLLDLGKKNEALSLYTAVYKDRETVLGPLHPDTLLTKMNAAICLSDLSQKEEALNLYTEVYEGQEKVLGPLHSDILRTKINTAVCLDQMGKNEEAMSLYNAVYEDQEKILGPLHPDTLTTKLYRASCLEYLEKKHHA